MEVYLYNLHSLIYKVARGLLSLADFTTKHLFSEIAKKEILVNKKINKIFSKYALTESVYYAIICLNRIG